MLTAIATIFVVISGVLYVIWVLTGFDASPINELYHIFDVAGEFNGGSWMAGVLWVLLAVATAWVAVHTRVRRLAWLLFAAVALMASLDEIAMLHERLWRLGAAIGNYLPFDPFSYRWVIAGLLIAVIVVLLLLPLMFSLPRRVFVGYLIAGFVFLLGAVGFETIGGYVEQYFDGQGTWHLKLLMHIEEWLEMIGVVIAIANTMTMLRWRRIPDGIQTEFAGYRR